MRALREQNPFLKHKAEKNSGEKGVPSGQLMDQERKSVRMGIF